MNIHFNPDSTVDALAQSLQKMESDSSVQGILLVTAEDNAYDAEVVSGVLQQLKKPVFGGLFPGLIYGNVLYNKGFIVVGVNSEISVEIIENISSPQTEFDDCLYVLAKRINKDTHSLFLFVDAISTRIMDLIDSIFMVLGTDYKCIGSGCGFGSFKPSPCIYTNRGLLRDAAIIGATNRKPGIGVSHGWEPVEGPFKITSCDKTMIKELDFKPAFDVYKKYVDQISGQELTVENFFSIAMSYPLGLQKIDTEKVVRSPLFVGPENSLVCVAEIDQGSYLYIMNGENDKLIKAASSAAEMATIDKGSSSSELVFFVDCISRKLLLGNDFDLELQAVQSVNSNIPLVGVLSLGEIANNNKNYLNLLNVTSVVGVF